MKLLSYFRSSAVAFPLAALAALAMFAISETSYREATGSLDSLGQRAQARLHLNAVARSLLDAETGQRGYLLTDRPSYLDPYRDATRRLQESLQWLQGHYREQTELEPVVVELVEQSRRKLSELALTIEQHDKDQTEAWRDLLLTDIGRERMDHVRELVDRLLAAEEQRVATGRKGVYQTLLLNRIGVSAMAALSLLALFMYLRQSAALDRATAEDAERNARDRDRLEAEVAARTEELRALARHLQTVREDERSRLARELHDELGALLTAAKLDAARLKSRLAHSQPDALERLAHLNDTLNGGIALKRRIIEDLRPSSLSNLGLIAALEILVREFAARSEILVHDRLQPVRLTAAMQLTVYRLVQEALTNIAKYAKANAVEVSLEPLAGDEVRVAVRDDGVGFDAHARTMTHGLFGMRFRVEAEGGRMRIESAPGEGTLIEAILPAAVEGDDEARDPLALRVAA